MGEIVKLADRRKPSVPEFDRVMERLFEAIDLIEEGAAREAVCDACDLLLRREEGMLAWPKR
jgi:hypothetical protein